MPDKDKLITLRELARELRCSEATLYRLAKERRLPCMRLGKSYRFRLDAVLEALEDGDKGE